MLNTLLTCPDSIPSFLNFLDLSVAPLLLFYSYIPVVILSLIFGVFVYRQSHGSLLGKIILTLSLVFSLWVIDLVIQWVSVYVAFDFFFWQTTPLLEIAIPLLALYFLYVFINDKDLPFWGKVLLTVPYIVVALVLPTHYNVSSFDLSVCEGNYGYFYYFIYAIEIAATLVAGWMSLLGLRKKGIPQERRRQFLLLGTAAVLFLAVFAATNITGEMLQLYELNLFGPIGLFLFIATLSYLIVQYQTFHIKLAGVQALLFAEALIILSLLFIHEVTTFRVVTGASFVFFTLFGIFTIRSVKREIESREYAQRLAGELAVSRDKLLIANEKLKALDQQKTEFVSIASHQLRSPLTAIKGYTSMILEGSYGAVTGKLREVTEVIFESSQRLINVIEDFLTITRIELGKIKYVIETFNLAETVHLAVNEARPLTEKRRQTIKAFIPETLTATGDRGKLAQVVGNLIDNAMKYTPEGGSIQVKLEAKSGRATLSVTDTGVGIPPEVLPKLFAKFTRGASESAHINLSGTGLGLYVVRQLVEAHGGTVRAISAGTGKGSTFIAEFPLTMPRNAAILDGKEVKA